jgi:hypothetical protein
MNPTNISSSLMSKPPSYSKIFFEPPPSYEECVHEVQMSETNSNISEPSVGEEIPAAATAVHI